MSELKINDKAIESMIYEIRGKQVMLDSDLAKLYQCSNGTKSINLAIKRNKERFPEDFYFQLTKEEYENLKFQFETSSLNNYGGIRKIPHVFTEQGVAMLATVLHTNIASEVSVRIMRTFVAMRKYLSNNLVEYKLLEHDKRINLLEEVFNKFKDKGNHIFFEGQIYDAYSLLIDLLNQSQEEIIIIDNYIDKKLLDIISKVNKKIILITANKLNSIDIEKYKIQYKNLEIKINNNFHDRFLILDKKILYHSGASFKDLGKKCFSINKIEDAKYLKQLLDYIIK